MVDMPVTLLVSYEIDVFAAFWITERGIPAAAGLSAIAAWICSSVQ